MSVIIKINRHCRLTIMTYNDVDLCLHMIMINRLKYVDQFSLSNLN